MIVNHAARPACTLPWVLPILLATLVSPCHTQKPATQPVVAAASMVLDGVAATRVDAVLDPFGQVQIVGQRDDDGPLAEFRLLFPAMTFPVVGEWPLGTGPAQVRIVLPGDKIANPEEGTLELSAFGEQGISGQVAWRGKERAHRMTFHAVPVVRALQPAQIKNARAWPPFPAPVDRPAGEDLVFCAFGDAGTGLIGQRTVARSIAGLAATGPLDFVLLLGDNFYPEGPRSTDDPLWLSRFEDVYDRHRLNVPFYAVLGDHDHAGSMRALIDYGQRSRRWTMPSNSYTFEVESHGKRIAFFAADTKSIIGDIAVPQHRIANRMLVHHLQTSKADWKIVFGHHPFVSNGRKRGSANSLKLTERLDTYFQQFGVDLYLCGDDHILELLAPRNGTTHVVSGGGAGPELAYPLTVADDTVFGHTGGGFTWFRFDGSKFEISFRDVDGKVLFVHHLKKGGG